MMFPKQWQAAIDVIHIIEQAGFEAFIVGGAVRDFYLKRDNADVDVATSALPEEIQAIFSQTIDVGIEHGTVLVRIVEAIMQAENAVLPVSAIMQGAYGIDGVALSLPSIVGINGVYRMLEMPLDDIETRQLQASAETLQNTLTKLGV